MSDYKIGIEVTVGTGGDHGAAENIGEYLANIIDTVLAGAPQLFDYMGVEYGITEAGKEASFATTVSEYGHSLAINVTKHAPGIGIQKGDRVAVTVRKIAGGTKE